MIRSRLFPVLLAVLLIAGCGGSSGPTAKLAPQLQTVPASGHPCSPGNYYMQCAAKAPGQIVNPFERQAGVFGVDFAWGGPSGVTARANGAHFGVSYLSGSSKDWTYGNLHSYPAAGLSAGLVYETSANRAISGCSGGTSDARRAAVERNTLGASSAAVYFAVDFDSSGYSSGGVITQYFHCAADVLGWSHTGVYGGLRTMQIVLDNGTVKYGWQTLAWSYGHVDSKACLYQSGVNGRLAGFSIDPDYALCRDWGQWPSPAPPPPPRPVCFGKHAQRTSFCRGEQAKVASWVRAKASSERAYVKRGCPVLAHRVAFFSGRLHSQPKVRTAYRRGALAASRRAYARQDCAVYAQRVSYFSGVIGATERRYG